MPSVRKRLAALTWPGGFRVVQRHRSLFLVNFRNFVDREIAFYGDFEREQIDVLTSAIIERGADLFIDIGANIGLYSVIVARGGLDVMAFEPDTRNVAQLRANIFLNQIADRVTVHELAVSDRSGPVMFQPFPNSSTGQSHVSEAGTQEVKAVSLDDFLAIRDRRLFFKIDIEGHELAAVRGMRRLLETNRCFLQIESLAPNDARLHAMMRGSGYRLLRSIGYDHFYDRA